MQQLETNLFKQREMKPNANSFYLLIQKASQHPSLTMM